MASLTILHNDGRRWHIELGPSKLSIGRALENELVLDDPDKKVSRFHAEIRCDRGRYVIKDLNSPNGVWVGDRQIHEEALADGVAVAIGPYRLALGDLAAATSDQHPITAPSYSEKAAQKAPLATASEPSVGSAPTAKTKSPGGGQTKRRTIRARVPLAIGGAVVLGVVAVVIIVSLTAPGRPSQTPPLPVTSAPPAQDPAPEQPLAPPAIEATATTETGTLPPEDPPRTDTEQALAAPPVRGPGRTGTAAAVARGTVPGLPPVSVRAGELPAVREARQQQAFDQYQEALRRINAGDPAGGAQALRDLLAAEPNYYDARERLADTGQRMAERQRELAGARLTEARQLLTEGDLPAARRAFEAALGIDPDLPQAADELKVVRQRMIARGEDLAGRLAGIYNSEGTDALRKAYQEVLDLLPADNAKRQGAIERFQSTLRTP